MLGHRAAQFDDLRPFPLAWSGRWKPRVSGCANLASPAEGGKSRKPTINVPRAQAVDLEGRQEGLRKIVRDAEPDPRGDRGDEGEAALRPRLPTISWLRRSGGVFSRPRSSRSSWKRGTGRRTRSSPTPPGRSSMPSPKSASPGAPGSNGVGAPALQYLPERARALIRRGRS